MSDFSRTPSEDRDERDKEILTREEIIEIIRRELVSYGLIEGAAEDE